MSTSMLSVSEQIARNVRGALGAARISQAQAAKSLKMSRSSFSQRINGHKAFEIDELAGIADATGVPFADLVNIKNQTEKAAA